MMKIAMSPAAAMLLRALIARSAVERNRILLTEANSVDWRSLTFTGERHQLSLRVSGSDSLAIAERMCSGLEEAEFSLPGVLVADIEVARKPRRALDGTTEFIVEALTLAQD